MEEIRNLALKYAIKERKEYGKANMKSVLAKMLGENKELRQKVRDIITIVRSVCEDVNNMNDEEVDKLSLSFSYEKPKKENKIWIENPTENVVTRFPPEPSGYLHIGHAKAALLNQKIAEDYKGEVLLRFDDTNPKKERWEFVEAIREDLEWLGFNPARESFTSDYIDRLYKVGKKLIELGKAYVTTASTATIKEYRKVGKPIPGREQDVDENLELFDKMLENEYKEGEIVVLFKGQPDHPNTAMRDPTLFRVIEGSHYRLGEKYIVWPTYDMAVPFVDSWEGVTHAIRSKEYELRKELYYELLDALNERKPTLMHFSRLNIKGVPLSKRVLRKLVEEKVVSGWDDPRMPTLKGLRRRGIHPEAIKKFALRFGIGKQEKVVGWDMLEKENRKVWDKESKRLMLVENPVSVEVEPPIKIVAPFHPQRMMGQRTLEASKILVEKEDWEGISKDGVVTLRYAGTYKRNENKLIFIGKQPSGKVIHWVSKENSKEIIIYFPNPLINEEGEIIKEKGKEIKARVEMNEEKINIGEVVQFERKYFARKDKEGYYIYSS